MSTEVDQLRQRVQELEAMLQQRDANCRREKIEQMSSEVVDSNPYR